MAGKALPLNLLRTKLYRPRATGDLIRRQRVRDTLDRNIERTLTLVCAPAGFGKTTLLSDWLSAAPFPNAWLSLDESDSDLTLFLRYFVASVRSLYPDSCADTLSLLQAPARPPLASFVTALANDLDRLAEDSEPGAPQRFVLVLDDYQNVQGQEVHSLLGEILRHPPRSLHLVISTRQDPRIPLHALRARGELAEIRVRELRFTPAEIAAFMEQTLGVPLDAPAVNSLAEWTEGWVTGLRLAALALTAGGDVSSPELAVNSRYVLDYLLNEVFAHIPVATYDFLLTTSILPRLSGPLCDAVAGQAGSQWDGQAYLEWLAAQNLFTFSLDAQGNWYRYHQLFQKLLRSQLERRSNASELAALHGRASAWFAQNGLVAEAIQHALAAGDEDAVVQMVQEHRHEMLNREQFGQLEHWLSLAPQRLVDTRPEMMMLKAWTLHGRFNLSDLAVCLDEIEAAMEQCPPSDTVARQVQGEIAALRSQVTYWSGDASRTLALAERALGLVPREWGYARAAALTYYLGALQMQGRLQEGVAVLENALQDDRLHGSAAQGRLLMILCAAYWMEADPATLLQTANRLLTAARDADLPDSLTRAHFYLGCGRYALNDLTGAEEHFAFVLDRRHEAYALVVMQSGFGLASVYQAQGLPERARAVVALVYAHATAAGNPSLERDAEAYAAHLALLQSRLADAESWAQRADHTVRATALPVFYASPLALVEVLLGKGTQASLDEAGRMLTELRAALQSTHNTRFLIEALALEALLHDARRNRATALETLAQAVRLAGRGGLVRVFVDLGPNMAALLRQLAARDETAEYVDSLLAAFGETPQPQPALRNAPVAPAALRDNKAGDFNTAPAGHKVGQNGQAGLIEPLSERELEVLALLNERLSNKEIAKELSISPMTVKRHTVNIYQKLSVGGRREAVAQAVELELIRPSSPASSS